MHRILRRRLEEEMERENLIPENQGFRRDRDTIDNIFILNHLILLKKEKKEKKRICDFCGFEGSI